MLQVLHRYIVKGKKRIEGKLIFFNGQEETIMFTDAPLSDNNDMQGSDYYKVKTELLRCKRRGWHGWRYRGASGVFGSYKGILFMGYKGILIHPTIHLFCVIF